MIELCGRLGYGFQMSQPSINTLLTPKEVLELVNSRYSIGEAQYCDLIRRGFNDHYLVEIGNLKYIFRVYLNHKYYIKSSDAFQFELDLLEHLHKEGVPVANALSMSNGELLGWTSTKLGERAFALFAYAAGKEVEEEAITSEQSFQFGKMTAKLHLAANSFKSNCKRYQLDLKYLVDEPLRLIAEQEDESSRVVTQQQYERIHEILAPLQPVEDLVTTVKALETRGDEFGIIHADLHTSNVHFQGNQVTFFDFDHCAYGWRAYDLAPLSFLPEEQYEKFIEGYESVRPLSEQERESLPTFKKLRRFWNFGDFLATASLTAGPNH